MIVHLLITFAVIHLNTFANSLGKVRSREPAILQQQRTTLSSLFVNISSQYPSIIVDDYIFRLVIVSYGKVQSTEIEDAKLDCGQLQSTKVSCFR